MIYFLLILLLIHVNYSVCRQYQIKEKVIPSYLYHSFYNISDDIFPSDFMIDISLSRVSGTLFYSVDSKYNQLIVSLNDASQPTLDIEFNKRHYYVSLSQLCGCERGRYERLKIRIKMIDELLLQCNDGKLEAHVLERNQKLNTDYPIPKFNTTNELNAHAWLVNTPLIDGIYPNSAQLSGCIFGVYYKDQPLQMESYGMGHKCSITCVNDICHSGMCLETHNNYPVCNCTDSFRNGQYCNSTLLHQDYVISQSLQFKVLKLSFQSVSGQLFELNNTRTSVQLLAKEKKLILIITLSLSYSTEIRTTLTKHYQKEDENIVIMVFEKTVIDVKVRRNNTSGIHIQIPHTIDLSREIFENVVLRSSKGSIDLAYKIDVTDLRWSKLHFGEDNLIDGGKNTMNNTITTTAGKFGIIEKQGRKGSINGNEEIILEMQILRNKVDKNFIVLLLLLSLPVSMGTIIILLVINRNKRKGIKCMDVSKEGLSLIGI